LAGRLANPHEQTNNILRLTMSTTESAQPHEIVTGNKRIHVLLVEDDDAMRAEFEIMVRANPEFLLTGSAATLAEAQALLRQGVPDVAIIDLGLPDGDGASLIDQLRRNAPDTAVLVMTVFGDETHVIRAIEAGARGYLLKDTSAEEFGRAIRMVHEGGSPLSPQIARHLLKRFVPAPAPHSPAPMQDKPDQLTPREIAILTRISQGFSVGETAVAMNISAHTVAAHVKNIYAKLAVHNRVEAVNHARHRGFIP
jgi:DNA-binding NarL/FixJ family response regulator